LRDGDGGAGGIRGFCGETNNKRTKTKGKSVNNKFDELAKSMAQSVTRRGALKKFGAGLAGMALAAFGLASKAEASGGGCAKYGSSCKSDAHCCSGYCLNGKCGCRTFADCPKGQVCGTPGFCISFA
jgi:hypothetical protein